VNVPNDLPWQRRFLLEPDRNVAQPCEIPFALGIFDFQPLHEEEFRKARLWTSLVSRVEEEKEKGRSNTHRNFSNFVVFHDFVLGEKLEEQSSVGMLKIPKGKSKDNVGAGIGCGLQHSSSAIPFLDTHHTVNFC
jgi:hypothetical protein